MEVRTKYRHRESEMQIQCVRWFRYQYPHLKMLLYHPKNEGTAGGRVQGAIAKAEGVVAGVADLILQVPAFGYHCLAIEMKTEKGRQSAQQKIFQCYLENAGGKYEICRSLDDFMKTINGYLYGMETGMVIALRMVLDGQRQEEERLEKKKLQRIISRR